MTIELNCPECGKAYKLPDTLAGKKARCKACSAVMVVPKQDDIEDFADLADDDVEDYDAAPPPRRRSTRSSRDQNEPTPKRKSGKKSRRSGGKSVLSSPWLWISVIGGGALLCIIVCCGMLPGMLQREAMKQAGIDPAKQVPLGSPDSLFPVALVPVPTFPDLGTPQVLQPSGVRVYFFQMPKLRGAAPGHSMGMRVYLPPGDAAPKSIPCVLVAPAGTPLIHGNDMDADDYHKETLPYAEAGMAVVFYSIDGPVTGGENAKDSEIAVAYHQFRAAHAGVVNGRNALEFALAKLPQVDPKRIYSSGHSSAGTLSLLLAAHEPRLAACVAFAPCTDVEVRQADIANNPAARLLFTDIKNFLRQSSPKTHAAKIGCPVFLFHAQDDGNVPVSESQLFAQQLQAAGKKAELKLVPTGNHYDSMVNEGVPAAVTWLKGLAGATPAGIPSAPQ